MAGIKDNRQAPVNPFIIERSEKADLKVNFEKIRRKCYAYQGKIAFFRVFMNFLTSITGYK